MRERDARFCCKNSECGHEGISKGECPECGEPMEPIRGDDAMMQAEDESGEPKVNMFDDDPDTLGWYSDFDLEELEGAI